MGKAPHRYVRIYLCSGCTLTQAGDEGSESTPVLSIESGLGLGLGIEWMYSDR